MAFSKEFLHIVDMGGFKVTTDLALNLRRVAFNFLIDHIGVLLVGIDAENLVKAFLVGFNDPNEEIGKLVRDLF